MGEKLLCSICSTEILDITKEAMAATGMSGMMHRKCWDRMMSYNIDKPESTPEPGPGVIMDPGAGPLETAYLIGMFIFVILFGLFSIGCVIYISIF